MFHTYIWENPSSILENGKEEALGFFFFFSSCLIDQIQQESDRKYRPHHTLIYPHIKVRKSEMRKGMYVLKKKRELSRRWPRPSQIQLLHGRFRRSWRRFFHTSSLSLSLGTFPSLTQVFAYMHICRYILIFWGICMPIDLKLCTHCRGYLYIFEFMCFFCVMFY